MPKFQDWINSKNAGNWKKSRRRKLSLSDLKEEQTRTRGRTAGSAGNTPRPRTRPEQRGRTAGNAGNAQTRPEHQDQPRSKKIHQDFLEEGETLHSQQAKEETDAEPKPRPPAKTGINAQSLKQSRKRRHKKKRKKEEQAKKKGRKKENITK